MEKQLFNLDELIGIPVYFPSQIIRSIRFLASTAYSILMKFKQAQTGFYSFRLTLLTEKL